MGPDSSGSDTAYKLRMTQTITQISTMVPISPYPNIVASIENTILGFSLPNIDLEGQRRVSVRHCIPEPIRSQNEVHVLLVKPRRICSCIEPIAAVRVLPASVVVAPTVFLKAGIMVRAKTTFVVFVSVPIFLTVSRILAV